jgi:hypothetical protein
LTGADEITFDHGGELIKAKVLGSGKNPNERPDSLPLIELDEV